MWPIVPTLVAGVTLAAAAVAQVPDPPAPQTAKPEASRTADTTKDITQIRWRMRAWSGDAWDNDVDMTMPVTPLPDGGWQVANTSKETGDGLAILSNINITDGPIEMIVRVPKDAAVAVGATSTSGKNLLWEAWFRGKNDWVRVVVGCEDGRPCVTAGDWPLPVWRTTYHVKECVRPHVKLPTGVRIEIRSCRQLPADERIITPASHLPAPPPPASPAAVEWRTVGKAGNEWSRDSPKGVTAARQADGSWLLTNSEDTSVAAALLQNLDARRGDVELEIRSSSEGIVVGLISASRLNMYGGVPIFERDRWVRARIGIAPSTHLIAYVHDRRETCNLVGASRSGIFPATDVYRPFVLLPAGATVMVRKIGQVPQAK